MQSNIMHWFGCRGCGWISELNVVGAVHVNSRCQFCNHRPVSLFDGTEDEYREMKVFGLHPK